MFKLVRELMSPEIPSGGSGGGSRSPEMSKEDIVDFLSDDKDDKGEIIPLDDKSKSKGEKDDETPDADTDDTDDDTDDNDDAEEDDDTSLEDELEEDLEGPTEDQLELMTPVARREILKKYPNVFKDFPYLERAYYREQQFTEVFPTVDDAKESLEKSNTLDKFEQDLMGGNTELMLKAVKSNPKAFNKIVDNYMDTLARVDEKAFHHVVGNTIKQTIMEMVKESRASNNEPLGMAAQILNQFVFGKSTFEPPKALSEPDKPGDDKESQLTARERAFNRNRLDSATSELNQKVNNSYKATIEANMDPKNSMTDYVRRNAIRDAQEKLETLISKDSRFKILVDKLWERAIEDNFSKSSTDKIRSAFMSKAKTLLQPVIKAARNEALRGMGKRVMKDSSEEQTSNTPPKKGPVKQGQLQSQQKSSGKISKSVPSGMSSLEFLMSDD
jgi:hypothetical protein